MRVNRICRSCSIWVTQLLSLSTLIKLGKKLAHWHWHLLQILILSNGWRSLLLVMQFSQSLIDLLVSSGWNELDNTWLLPWVDVWLISLFDGDWFKMRFCEESLSVSSCTEWRFLPMGSGLDDIHGCSMFIGWFRAATAWFMLPCGPSSLWYNSSAPWCKCTWSVGAMYSAVFVPESSMYTVSIR